MASDRQTVLVRLQGRTGKMLVHKSLRSRLVTYAKKEKLSLNEAAVKILAEKYDVPFVPTTKVTTPARQGEELMLSIPVALYTAIVRFAATSGRIPTPSVQVVIRQTLGDHFGLQPPKGRRPAAAA